MRRSLSASLVAIVVASAAACSSSVEIGSPNGSNQSASHAGDLCDEVCAIPACGNAVEDCHADCEALYYPGCTAETEAMLECAVDVITTKCELEGDMCPAEHAAHDACKP
jgi:hypothetical protein